jgi:polysaccharide export outer membrane protein
MTLVDIAAALARTTLATSVAALVAWALLAALRIHSPRIHRIAWLLVIAQGWLFFPLTIEIETTPPPTTKRAAGLVPAEITERLSNPLSADAARGREPFATDDSPMVEAPQSLQPPAPAPVPLAIAVWLFGAFALVITAARRYVQVIRALPLGSPPEDPSWQAEWHAARTAAKLCRRQPVDLRITASLGPLLHWAPWAYFILVPRPLWTSLAAPQRQAILRHELAHLRRRDLWKSLTIRALALPQWFNPLAWLAVRRFDEAAEWACDDAAARHADDRLAFANSLLQSAEYAVAPYPASAPAARGTLTRRIHRLVSPRFTEESKMKLLLVPTLLVLAAVAQVVRIQRVDAEEPQQPPASRSWSLAEEFSLPLAERLEETKRRHAQLLAERQRAVDAAESSSHAAPQDDRHLDTPASIEQMNFDQLAKEFENFARMDYVIDPPDILSIEGVKLVPKAPHRLEAFDTLQIRVTGAFPVQPIDNAYNVDVDADGTVNLGPTCGRIAVVGQTIKEADDAIRAELSRILPDVDVTVTLLASSSAQAITGQHLVSTDGRVDLGNYGSVFVAGMTRKEARAAIELKLAEQLDDPKVSVDVLGYNSKVYYVITKGARRGDDVTRASIPFPVDGKENVAKALTQVFSDAKHDLAPSELTGASVTLRRAAPNGVGVERVYAIEWDPATNAPTPVTNHGILPGDRLFVELTPAAALRREEAFLRVSAPTPAAPFVNYYAFVDRSAFARPEARDESYRLKNHDTVKLRVSRPHRPAHTLTWGDIEGEFTVNQDGAVELGRATGGVAVSVAGLTAKDARHVIEQQLRQLSPGCELQLTLGTLATEKYVISIQRADGTELAVGALRPDYVSKSDFLEWPLFRSFIAELTPISQVKLERADRHGQTESIKLTTIWDAIQAPQMPANDHPVRPGDRLVVTVADDWQPRIYPSWLEPRDLQRRRGETLFRIRDGWSQVGGVKFDHSDVQRPAAPHHTR